MHIKDIKKLPVYIRMTPVQVWRNVKHNDGFTKQSSSSKDLLSNKGSGWIYIIKNSQLKNWFKVGCTKHSNIEKRLTQYKSIVPIGNWEVVYWEYADDIACEELKLKQFYKYECLYKNGVNSKEWFYGDWEVCKNITKLKYEKKLTKVKKIRSEKYLK